VGRRSEATGAVSLRRRRLIDICSALTSTPRIDAWPDGLVGSMGRHGNPYDNAKAESVMKTLKVEAVYLMAYPSGAVSSTRRYARR